MHGVRGKLYDLQETFHTGYILNQLKKVL